MAEPDAGRRLPRLRRGLPLITMKWGGAQRWRLHQRYEELLPGWESIEHLCRRLGHMELLALTDAAPATMGMLELENVPLKWLNGFRGERLEAWWR